VFLGQGWDRGLANEAAPSCAKAGGLRRTRRWEYRHGLTSAGP
jgi:hypothetical protein